jgi:hypothetical protein
VRYKFTCYITRVQLCNCGKTTVGPRFAFWVVCLIIRFKQHALKPAIYHREKLQHIEYVKTRSFGYHYITYTVDTFFFSC